MAEEFKGLSQEQLNKLDQFKQATAEVYESYKAINKELNDAEQVQDKLTKRQFQGRDVVDRIAQLQKEAVTSTDAARKLEVEKAKQLTQIAKLEARRVTLLGKAQISAGATRKLYIKQAENLQNVANHAQGVADAISETQEDAAKLDKSASFFGDISKVVGDIPGLRKLVGPFDAAAKASKEMALENAKGGKQMSTLKAGTDAFGKSMGAAVKKFLPLLIISTVVKAIKFLVDIMMGANKEAVGLARAMGTSVENAQVLRKQFAQIRTSTGRTRNNVAALVEAQSQLNEEFGAVLYSSDQILDNQTLTSRVKLSAEEASKLAIRMAATNESTEDVNKNTISFMNSFGKATGVGMTFKGVMSSVADAGGQIAASFGFSNESLAKGVLQVRRFGLNLQQASNVASSLLDFEQSIGAELEAELLTGQQFNLERARAKAATGDIAGATADVLSQMQNLTAEQRASPIIMDAIAKATGLSADEIQKAYLIQTNQNAAAKEYERLIKAGMRGEANAFAIRAGIDDKTIEGIEKRKSIEEDFGEAMKDLKSTFTSLVEGGFLRDLTNGAKIFAQVVNKLAYSMGLADPEEDLKRIQDSNASNKIKAVSAKIKGYTEGSISEDWAKGGGGFGGIIQAMAGVAKRYKAQQLLESISNNSKIKSGEQMDDFTIRSNPKDTLVMAGGTQFGKETNGLLRQLISAVEGGKVINLEGRKVGETLVMSSYKS